MAFTHYVGLTVLWLMVWRTRNVISIDSSINSTSEYVPNRFVLDSCLRLSRKTIKASLQFLQEGESIGYSALSISRGHFSPNNSRKTSVPRPLWVWVSFVSSKSDWVWYHAIVKPVCNDHLHNKIYCPWFIQQCVLMKTVGTNSLFLTISAFWSSSRWPLAT